MYMVVGFLHLQFFDYAMSVLYPECLIRFIMDFYCVDFEEVFDQGASRDL